MKITRRASYSLFLLTVSTATPNADAQQFPPTYTEPDGYNRTCFAPHRGTRETVPVAGINGNANGFWAYATYNPAGWPVIIFDVPKMVQYPRIVWRFTYFHECAHLTIPTSDEIRANCAALVEMRANGELDEEDEKVVEHTFRSLGSLGAQYGGSGDAFWNATLSCAGQRD